MKTFTVKSLSYLRLFFLAVLLSSFSFTPAFSQAKDSKGTDFWLMFNHNLSAPKLTLFIASDVNTSGTVSIPGMSFSTSFSVTANSLTPVEIPVAAAEHTNGVVDNKGIHVTAQNEVTVYGLNYAPFTTDAYLGLPTDVLGTDYVVLTYSGQNASEFGVVGTQDGTTVTITQSVAAGGHAAGVPYNITLNQGQTFEVGNATDLTGTIITSNKPIGVMGANGCANIPPGYSYCDHINEMIPPTTTWGRRFATVPLKSRTNGDTFRFMATEDNTVITINGGAPLAPLNRGQHAEIVLTTRSVIESSKPILVAQFANGSSFSGNPGDPFMMLIPPLEQFLPKYTVTTVSGYVAHFINVVAPSSIVGSLTLDGVAISAAEFSPIGSSGFSGAQLTISPGIHNLSGSLAFGVFVYGFNNDDSYGYPGGQSFSAVATVNKVTLDLQQGTTATVGQQYCIGAIAKDQNDQPIEGVRVDFNITGVNPQIGFAFTNANGVAQFCYTGNNAGVDNIVASVGGISDNTQVTWNTGGGGTCVAPTFLNDGTIVLDASCGNSDGLITLIPTSGTAPFMYSINGGVTYVEGPASGYSFQGLAAGTYQLRIKDANGCESAIVTREVRNLYGGPTFRNDATIVLDASCTGNDGNISIIPTTGTAPFMYSIDGGATYVEGAATGYTFQNLAPGTYQLRLKDANGCESAVVTREVRKLYGGPLFKNDGTIVLDASCGANDGNISIIPTCGAAPFMYSIDGGVTYVEGPATGYTFQNLAPGTYQLRLKDAYGSESAIVTREVRPDFYGPCATVTAAGPGARTAQSKDASATLRAYPNPSRGMFQVQVGRINAPRVQLQVVDARGTVLQSRMVNAQESSVVDIDLSGKAKGLYLIRVLSDKGTQQTKVLLQ